MPILMYSDLDNVPSNNKAAELLGINEVQRLNLRLIERASFNNMNGFQIVKDLISHMDLWESCLIDRESKTLVTSGNKRNLELNLNLIKLRDIESNYWNVDTLFILQKWQKNNKYKKATLRKLIKTWKPDDIELIGSDETNQLLGGIGPTGKGIYYCLYKIWWD